MKTATAAVPTRYARRYVDQLCKHWSHKLAVTQDGATARIVMFSGALVTLHAGETALDVAIEAKDQAGLDETVDVVVRHLDRFAFREAPLAFDWVAR